MTSATLDRKNVDEVTEKPTHGLPGSDKEYSRGLALAPKTTASRNTQITTEKGMVD